MPRATSQPTMQLFLQVHSAECNCFCGAADAVLRGGEAWSKWWRETELRSVAKQRRGANALCSLFLWKEMAGLERRSAWKWSIFMKPHRSLT